MVQQAHKTPVRRSNRTARNAPRSASRRAHGRNGRRSKVRDISELERVIRSLEAQIARLTNGGEIRATVSNASDQVGSAVSRASHQVGDVVADTLTQVADQLRTGATSVTTAARVGTSAIARIGTELERRPFMTVAIAVGIGFLAGLAGRREQA